MIPEEVSSRHLGFQRGNCLVASSSPFLGAGVSVFHARPISLFTNDAFAIEKEFLKYDTSASGGPPLKLVTMSDPPPAIKGDLTWHTATVVSFWTVAPLYGMFMHSPSPLLSY
jgi:hypothetical protein